ncbi:MAG: putative 10 kDa chaperonin [Prokaryotic dsDNA virus sp.]|nr:hypothetical protein [Aequorivita sp.]QDP57277.1 MAG: putative 10 kDa chaperonin [Prokaryotic dsDNA virus sp.]|tara:strand:+ start:6850 stop:7401 length:552 start_codon:yes stop_codon:yes gene_type:complete
MIKALKGKVIIKEIEDENKTPSGIIKTTAETRSMMGKVTYTTFEDIKVGDVILFGRHAGKDIEMEGTKYRVIPGEDITAITNGTLDSISPIGDWLLVEPVEVDKKVGSIIIPGKEKAADDHTWSKVIKVGPGKVLANDSLCPMSVQAGDEVLCKPYSSIELRAWGKTLVMIPETMVVARKSAE